MTSRAAAFFGGKRYRDERNRAAALPALLPAVESRRPSTDVTVGGGPRGVRLPNSAALMMAALGASQGKYPAPPKDPLANIGAWRDLMAQSKPPAPPGIDVLSPGRGGSPTPLPGRPIAPPPAAKPTTPAPAPAPVAAASEPAALPTGTPEQFNATHPQRVMPRPASPEPNHIPQDPTPSVGMQARSVPKSPLAAAEHRYGPWNEGVTYGRLDRDYAPKRDVIMLGNREVPMTQTGPNSAVYTIQGTPQNRAAVAAERRQQALSQAANAQPLWGGGGSPRPVRAGEYPLHGGIANRKRGY